MGDHRTGPYALRTPDQAKEELTLPVFGVLLGTAIPVFPGRSLARPSRKVGIFPASKASPCGKPKYTWPAPVWVDPGQWENAVVPVLLDPKWDVNLPVNVFLREQGKFVDLLGEALRLSFVEAGYGPA